MSNDINWRIGVVQMDCVLGDVAANLAKIAHFAEAGGRLGVDLLVFPETATTGYFIAERIAALAESVEGPTVRRLGEIASSNRLHIAVGAATRDAQDRFYDAQLLFAPDGALLAEYRKVHLFAAERDCYTPGDNAMVVDTALGKIGLSVCYDLIFPELSRRLVELGAQLIVNSTNWITDDYQRSTWGWGGPIVQGLAATRALENTTFVAMASRVGTENGFDSLGYSCVAGPSGMLFASLRDGEGLAIADIDIAGGDLESWRGIATYHADRRPEIYSP